MEIRRGSQEGKVVFSGTVEKGRQHGFALKSRLWIYVGRPRNIDLVVAGRPQPAPARLLYVDANGVRRAPAVR